MAIKPKQWLYDNGHLASPKGRGRVSKEHKALIMAAVATGAAIEGYSIVRGNDANTSTAAPKVERVAADPNRVMDVPDMSRDERETMGYYISDGKRIEIGMRTVDNNCGNSLTYCRCESPRVWVDYDRQVVVLFSTRKN